MSKTSTTKTIPADWLSKRDAEFLSDLVQEWLQENNNDTGGFSFWLEVTWEEKELVYRCTECQAEFTKDQAGSYCSECGHDEVFYIPDLENNDE